MFKKKQPKLIFLGGGEYIGAGSPKVASKLKPYSHPSINTLHIVKSLQSGQRQQT
jgi:hypothetical protein